MKKGKLTTPGPDPPKLLTPKFPTPAAAADDLLCPNPSPAPPPRPSSSPIAVETCAHAAIVLSHLRLLLPPNPSRADPPPTSFHPFQRRGHGDRAAVSPPFSRPWRAATETARAAGRRRSTGLDDGSRVWDAHRQVATLIVCGGQCEIVGFFFP